MSLTYVSYEKYDFINNIYIPYGQLILAENGQYFSVSKENCQSKTYQINKKEVSSTQSIHYELSSTESAPAYNPCFSSAINIDLTYKSDDSTRTYYSSSLFGDNYNLFKNK